MAPWTARNYRAFHELRPLGGTAGQTHSAYVDWLNTWADDPVYLDRYWWNALNSTYPAEFPAGKLVGDEKQQADNALALARSQGTFAGKPMQVFAGLAENAKHDRPWQSYVAVPVRRFAMTWIRMPSSVESKPGRAIAYTFWVGLLGLTLIGLYGALSWQNRVVCIPLMMVFGRAVLPLLSFLATEPRYMLEALPACFILSVLGLFMALGIRPRSLKYEAYQMFQTDSIGDA
jgi:hypothetical protein